jgi:hypothetical protein
MIKRCDSYRVVLNLFYFVLRKRIDSKKASEEATRDFSKSKRIFWPMCQKAPELAQPVYGEARRTLRSPK